jgi:hypothetical protein
MCKVTAWYCPGKTKGNYHTLGEFELTIVMTIEIITNAPQPMQKFIPEGPVQLKFCINQN